MLYLGIVAVGLKDGAGGGMARRIVFHVMSGVLRSSHSRMAHEYREIQSCEDRLLLKLVSRQTRSQAVTWLLLQQHITSRLTSRLRKKLPHQTDAASQLSYA